MIAALTNLVFLCCLEVHPQHFCVNLKGTTESAGQLRCLHSELPRCTGSSRNNSVVIHSEVSDNLLSATIEQSKVALLVFIHISLNVCMCERPRVGVAKRNGVQLVTVKDNVIRK